jgi:hypothetical protein
MKKYNKQTECSKCHNKVGHKKDCTLLKEFINGEPPTSGYSSNGNKTF